MYEARLRRSIYFMNPTLMSVMATERAAALRASAVKSRRGRAARIRQRVSFRARVRLAHA
jgi:hypothetical protein